MGRISVTPLLQEQIGDLQLASLWVWSQAYSVASVECQRKKKSLCSSLNSIYFLFVNIIFYYFFKESLIVKLVILSERKEGIERKEKRNKRRSL